MVCSRPAVVGALTLYLVQPGLAVAGAAAVQRSEAAVAEEVRRAISAEGELRRLSVSVAGSEVTLSGSVPTLWVKQDAIKRALKVDGVETVVSDIELPRLKSDFNLASNIGSAIGGYLHYTIFDYVDGVIRNGVVTLTGSVTPDRDKAREITDEIARVRGVQEIRNEIVTLPTSFGDDQIRVALFRRIFGNIHFERISHANPPFRLVVHHGVVSLYGVVQSQIEYLELESIARFTSGVLRVNNHLKTRTKPKQ